jgi:hypothetical protein
MVLTFTVVFVEHGCRPLPQLGNPWFRDEEKCTAHLARYAIQAVLWQRSARDGASVHVASRRWTSVLAADDLSIYLNRLDGADTPGRISMAS